MVVKELIEGTECTEAGFLWDNGSSGELDYLGRVTPSTHPERLEGLRHTQYVLHGEVIGRGKAVKESRTSASAVSVVRGCAVVIYKLQIKRLRAVRRVFLRRRDNRSTAAHCPRPPPSTSADTLHCDRSLEPLAQ